MSSMSIAEALTVARSYLYDRERGWSEHNGTSADEALAAFAQAYEEIRTRLVWSFRAEALLRTLRKWLMRLADPATYTEPRYQDELLRIDRCLARVPPRWLLPNVAEPGAKSPEQEAELVDDPV